MSMKYQFECPPESVAASDIKEVIDCDIVVVGAGISGTPAAMKAAEMGAKVCVIEKGETFGLHRNGFAAFNTKAQKRAGIELPKELLEEMLAKFWGSTMAFQGRMPLTALWMRHSGEVADWIIDILESKGLKVEAVKGGGITGVGKSSPVVNRNRFWDEYCLCHAIGKTFEEGENPNWMQPLVEYAVEQGAKYYYSTVGKYLLQDDTGRVSGIVAEQKDGSILQFNASKGVILATGDFINDDEMVSVYCPHLAKNVNNFSNKNCTGDGHKMAIWIGADMDQIVGGDLFPGQTVTGRNLHPNDPYYAKYMDWWWCPAVASMPMLHVDISGVRFANEDLPFQQNAVAEISMPEGRAWSIWDSAWKEKFPIIPEKTPSSLNTQERIEKDIEEGITVRADSIEELADLIHVPVENLKKTIERYNQLCENGYDEDCLKDPIWLKPIDQPPYYAAGIGAAITSTRGGLKINENMQVLDKKGVAIQGLYAVGNTAGSFYGMVYPPQIEGSGIGHGHTFAYLAAKHAASQGESE